MANQPDHLVTPGANNLTLPGAILASGIYLLRVTTPESQFVRRIVVAH